MPGLGGWQHTQEHPAGADAPQASSRCQRFVTQTLILEFPPLLILVIVFLMLNRQMDLSLEGEMLGFFGSCANL